MKTEEQKTKVNIKLLGEAQTMSMAPSKPAPAYSTNFSLSMLICSWLLLCSCNSLILYSITTKHWRHSPKARVDYYNHGYHATHSPTWLVLVILLTHRVTKTVNCCLLLAFSKSTTSCVNFQYHPHYLLCSKLLASFPGSPRLAWRAWEWG